MFKKIMLTMVLASFLFAPVAIAGECPSTITASLDGSNSRAWSNDQKVNVFKVTYTQSGAATNLAEFILGDCLQGWEKDRLRGGLLYQVVTDGDDTATPDAYTLAFDDGFGADILSITTAETGGKAEWFDGAEDRTDKPIVNDLQLDFPDIGADADIAVVYIFIVK